MTFFARGPLSAAIMAMPVAVQAGPDRVSILLGSHHVNAQRDFQEFNPGVFLTWEGRFDYSVGLYYNSYKEISPLVSVGYDWTVAPGVDVGAFFALAVYPGDGDEFSVSVGDVVPLVGLQARYRNVFVQLIPADMKPALKRFMSWTEKQKPRTKNRTPRHSECDSDRVQQAKAGKTVLKIVTQSG